MQQAKAAEVLSRLLMFAFGIVFAAIVLLISAIPSPRETETLAWGGVAFFIACVIDIFALFVRQGFEIRSSVLGPDRADPWAKIGRVSAWISIGGGVPLLLAFAALWGVIIVQSPGLQITRAFVVQVLVYFFYVLVRIPLQFAIKSTSAAAKPAAPSRVEQFFQGHLPVCRVVPGGITIDLKMGNTQHKQYSVQIPFAEIDELQAMTFFEAQAYEKYNIGANVPMALQQAKDLYLYMKGAIPRPTVYLNAQSGGPTLLIRGRNVFYLITVNPNGVDEVMAAWIAFKSRAPLPPRGAAAPPSPSPISGASAR